MAVVVGIPDKDPQQEFGDCKVNILEQLVDRRLFTQT